MEITAKLFEFDKPDKNGKVYSKVSIDRMIKKINSSIEEIAASGALEHKCSDEEIANSIIGKFKCSELKIEPINIFDYAEYDYSPSHGVSVKFNKPSNVSDEDWELSMKNFYSVFYGGQANSIS